MKKEILLSFVFCLFGISTFSQVKNLWVTASDGGNGYGTILKSDSTGLNWQLAASFNYVNGSYPQSKLLMAGDNRIYGATRRGGTANSCVLFHLDTATNIITKIYDFMNSPQTGAIPYSSLIQGNDCLLYGMTWDGGANGKGVIYSLDPDNYQYTDLYDFVLATGSNPFGDLVQATNGKFYGMGTQGGTNGDGVIFSYDPIPGTYDTLMNFSFASGGSPAYGSLIQAPNGLLYGMTKDGGMNGDGAIFSYNITTDTYLKLHDFGNTNDGAHPFGSLLYASNGKLYGMTLSGGGSNLGVLFSYEIATSTYTILLDFDGMNGSKPQRGLTQISNGKLFGTTMYGGVNNHGVIFNYDINSGTYTKVFDFDSTVTGAHPTSEIFESGAVFNPCALSVPELISQSVTISPNPATDELLVSFKFNHEVEKFLITDITGRVLIDQLFVDVALNEMHFSLNEFSPGTYFISIIDITGNGVTKKFLKM